ncbi:MAG TPA: peptide-methionine (R)-S-oxide reductase MsrB [Rhizomicrobium sp.]|jgi:peptide-methionine (R)-S-oxide reductase|nr:peptide-methionine (R)-S-oxide reductase MsrB [Rhizomicrobium sp.]
MQRRNFIGFLLASTAGACLGGAPALAAFPVTKSDAEWKKALSPAAYDVLRHQGTEMPFSSPLDMNTKKGTYSCAGCGVPLFSSDTKYDSKTGWPSFWKPLAGAVLTQTDTSDMMIRTEVHCHSCGGHLGHVFDDGPKPTGLRYCMNGVALQFKAA